MKKRVLFFACLPMLFSLGASAQDFFYKVKSTDVAVATLPAQNAITVAYNSSTAATVDGTSGYYYWTLNNGAARIVSFSSPNNIVKISVQYRGTGANNATDLSVSYGNDAAAADALPVKLTAPIAANSNIQAPGILAEFTIPGGGAKYVQIKYSSATSRIYYIAAGATNYTLPTDYLTLPLELLSFSAKPDALGKSVNLSWKTAKEVNTQDFVVERRSDDDSDFSVVDVVPSKNIEGIHSYTFTDKNPLTGNSYYRLKQRDRDGKFTFSGVVDVKIEGIGLSLHPNPVTKELVVSHEYVKKGFAIKVIGLDGKNYLKTNTYAGTSSTIVNVADLPTGTYLLVYEGSGKTQSQKFIKK